VALRAELVLLVPRLSENGVRMRIDETGSENTSTAIHYFAATVRRHQVLRRAERRDPAIPHRDRDVAEHAGVGHFAASARASWSGAGDDLGGVYKEEITHIEKSELKTTRFALIA
jgi:hypothetical protein